MASFWIYMHLNKNFYAAYISGEEPEDDSWVLDFGEWASVYRTWLARKQAGYYNSYGAVKMFKTIHAIYKQGILKPLRPIEGIEENTEVEI